MSKESIYLMVDIIWGNGSEILSKNSFVLNVTHRKNGNKINYDDSEKIQIVSADIPGLPVSQNDWNEDLLKKNLIGTFLKCEIEEKDNSGMVIGKVSHSGVGGY